MKRYVVLVLLLCFSLPLLAEDTTSGPPDLQNRLQQLKKNSLQREKLIIELSKRLDQAKSDYARLKEISTADKKRLQRQEKKIENLERQLKSARTSLTALNAELLQVKKRLKESERSRKKAEQSLQDYSRQLWIERVKWGAIGAALGAIAALLSGV
jgi:septal ring factor EnvC (AmiA/AmiB activator)